MDRVIFEGDQIIRDRLQNRARTKKLSGIYHPGPRNYIRILKEIYLLAEDGGVIATWT